MKVFLTHIKYIFKYFFYNIYMLNYYGLTFLCKLKHKNEFSKIAKRKPNIKFCIVGGQFVFNWIRFSFQTHCKQFGLIGLYWYKLNKQKIGHTLFLLTNFTEKKKQYAAFLSLNYFWFNIKYICLRFFKLFILLKNTFIVCWFFETRQYIQIFLIKIQKHN